MKTLRFSISLLISIVLGFLSLNVAVASAGMGHGSYFWAIVLFPFTMLFAIFADSITAPLILLAIVQFPIYGISVGLASLKGKLIHALICVIAIHAVAVGLFFGVSSYVPRSERFLDAVQMGDAATVTDMLDKRADPNTKTPHTGVSALQLAALEGHLEIAKLLLERGADINYYDPALGTTALHDAVVANRPSMVQFLLAQGADIRIKDSFGSTALGRARKSKNAEIIALFEAADEGVIAEEPK